MIPDGPEGQILHDDDEAFSTEDDMDFSTSGPANVRDDPCEECDDLRVLYFLVDDLVADIVYLQEEVVRWRQILLKHLDPLPRRDLECDLLSGLSLNTYYDKPAYIDYLRAFKYKDDPMDNDGQARRILRIAHGDDPMTETICSLLYS